MPASVVMRSRRRVCVPLIAVALVFLVATVGLATANEPPVAEAGLDQTVDVETAVYLDAGGSHDPDGAIAATTWTVVAPNGTVVNTSCANCTRTRFSPTQPGRYEATVTVTDDAGTRTNDTLYVTARAVARPSIEIVGPNETTTGSTSFVLDAAPGDADLLEAEFYVNGTHNDTVSFSDDGNATVSYSFSETSTYPLRAVVRDTDGYTNSTETNVSVVSGGGGSADVCGQILTYGADGAETTQSCGEYFNDDLTTYLGDDRVVTDLDNDGEISSQTDSITVAGGSESVFGGGFSNTEPSSGSNNADSDNSDRDNVDQQGYDYSNWGP